MAAYRVVFDSRHLQANCQKTGMSSGTLRWTIEFGLTVPFNPLTIGLSLTSYRPDGIKVICPDRFDHFQRPYGTHGGFSFQLGVSY